MNKAQRVTAMRRLDSTFQLELRELTFFTERGAIYLERPVANFFCPLSLYGKILVPLLPTGRKSVHRDSMPPHLIMGTRRGQ